MARPALCQPLTPKSLPLPTLVQRIPSVVGTLENDLYKPIIMQRYKDVDPAIRAAIIRCLGMTAAIAARVNHATHFLCCGCANQTQPFTGDWVVRFPQQFLNNKYIKFAGWMLSDIDPAVRLEAATVLTSVYDSVRHTPAR